MDTTSTTGLKGMVSKQMFGKKKKPMPKKTTMSPPVMNAEMPTAPKGIAVGNAKMVK